MAELWAARCWQCGLYLARNETERRARSAMNAHAHTHAEIIREADLLPRQAEPVEQRPFTWGT